MVLCFGKCFRVREVELGPLFIKTIAIVCAERYLVMIGVVDLMLGGSTVRRRWCIVRHGLEYFSRLVIRSDGFVSNVQAGEKARRCQEKDRR